MFTKEIDLRIYDLKIIKKCFYWYLVDYDIEYKMITDSIVEIQMKPLNSLNLDFIELNKKVNQDLHDYSLRQIVIEETKNIRDLIVAKAFSNDSIKELPVGFFSDPMGINIEEFNND